MYFCLRNKLICVLMGALYVYCIIPFLALVVPASHCSEREQCGVEASSHPLHRDPWTAYLGIDRGRNLPEKRCAATLVSKKHLLTAAHCVTKSKRLLVRLGEYQLSTKVDCIDGICADPPVEIPVLHIFIHPQYDGKKHDIAVLELAENTPYTDFIHPVCLPTGEINTTAIFHSSGWGQIPFTNKFSNVKKFISLPYWSRFDCQAVYTEIIPDHVICAGGQEGSDTCDGDSGGSLVLAKDSVEIWGITSRGPQDCGKEGKPATYTNVLDHLEWVYSVLVKERSNLSTLNRRACMKRLMNVEEAKDVCWVRSK